MANLLEQLYLEINSFSETSIPLPGADLDLMLFPYHANPREIKDWDVPILIANLEEMKTPSWDITLFKVRSFKHPSHLFSFTNCIPIKRLFPLSMECTTSNELRS